MPEGRFGAALEDAANWEGGEGDEGAAAHAALQTDQDTDFGGREAVGGQPAADDAGQQTQANTFGLTDEQLAALGESAQLPANLAAQAQAQAGQQPGQPAPAAQQPSPLRDYLVQNHGLQALADAPNDTEAIGRLVDVLSTLQQQNQQLGQQIQYFQLQAQQARQMPGQQGVPGPGQQAQAQSPWQAPPDFDPLWMQKVERLADGRLVAKQGEMPDIPAKIEAYDKFVREQSAALWKNPAEFVMKAGLDQQIQPMIQQAISEALANHSARNFGEQLRREHGEWMFAKDHTGREIIDPIRGGPMLTPEGQRVTEHLVRLMAGGQYTKEEAWQTAMQLVTGQGSLAFQAWQRMQGQQPGQQQVNLNDPAQRQQAQQASNAAFLQRQAAAARKPNQAARGRGPRQPAADQIPLKTSDLFEALAKRNLAQVANGTAA